MISAADPVLKRVELTSRDLARIPGVPWAVSAAQVVNDRQCLILEIDGQRVRLMRGGRTAVTMDGPVPAVEYVLFWIQS